ncbi:MAG: type 1 glutamine amidotransferase [Planctomycetota bacterium]
MAILITEHHPLDSSCRLGEVLRDHGHKLRTVRIHANEPLPEDLDDIDAVISMGGPQDTDQLDEHPWMARELEIIKQAHDAELPVLGVCLGAQLIAVALGGEVSRMDKPEVGFEKTTQSFFGSTDPLLQGIPWNTMAYHAHGCEVTKAPAGGTPIPLVSSAASKNQAFRVGLTTYGFQYHFEWTRKRIGDFLDHFHEFAAASGKSRAELNDELDQHYDMYRHLGDRLCQNLCDRLFSINRRLPSAGGTVANYHPQYS